MTESHEDRSKVTIPDLAGTPAPPPETAPPPDAPRAVEAGNGMPLFSGDEGGRLRERWDSIQTGFVDEPRHAVEEADGLVAEAMEGLAKQFADERSKLEAQWSRGSDISTEDLRQALRRYRSFFDRLLAA